MKDDRNKRDAKQKKNTVKRNLFISNTLMVVIILVLFLVINLGVVKIYSESIEKDFRVSVENTIDEDELEEMTKGFTIYRQSFVLLLIADAVLCVAGLILVSWFFTRRLAGHIMKPLDALTEGAERIKENDFSQMIYYNGDAEFESVCDAFNDMQWHVWQEQEKNRQYEKSRTDMIAGISHDLRTPLTAIRGTIKALLDGIVKEPAQQQKFLNAAYRRTGDMDVLLNQLFYLSKLETGNMPVEMSELNISSFIEKYVTEKKEAGLEDSVNLSAETGQIREKIMADPEQLLRIFDNLFENSRKYAQTSPLQIKITLTENDEGVTVRFADNGVGVPEEKLPYIFDEFYRADESRNCKEGNGLGLYIVKYLMQAMGGSVRAENIQEGGDNVVTGFAVAMTFPHKAQKDREEQEECRK